MYLLQYILPIVEPVILVLLFCIPKPFSLLLGSWICGTLPPEESIQIVNLPVLNNKKFLRSLKFYQHYRAGVIGMEAEMEPNICLIYFSLLLFPKVHKYLK